MTEQTQQYSVLVAVYTSKEDAQAVVGQIEEMAKQGFLTIGDVAIVYKDENLKVHVNDLADEHKKGWGTGAVVGGIVGVLFPPSLLVGAAVGAGVGSAYHHFRDKGISNKELSEAGEQLTVDQYALIAIVQDKFFDEVAKGLEGYEKLGKYILNADAGVLVSANTE